MTTLYIFALPRKEEFISCPVFFEPAYEIAVLSYILNPELIEGFFCEKSKLVRLAGQFINKGGE